MIRIDAYTYKMSDRRKEELEKKRQKLNELRKLREERKATLDFARTANSPTAKVD